MNKVKEILTSVLNFFKSFDTRDWIIIGAVLALGVVIGHAVTGKYTVGPDTTYDFTELNDSLDLLKYELDDAMVIIHDAEDYLDSLNINVARLEGKNEQLASINKQLNYRLNILQNEINNINNRSDYTGDVLLDAASRFTSIK